MKSIAITGSFGSGKTFILKYLERMGYKVFSCDEYVATLYLDQNIQKELSNIFDGIGVKFDKKQLTNIVYNNDDQRKKLEEYIHPKVIKGISDFKNKYKNENFIFLEVPLLFEAGFGSHFDYTVCVYCSEGKRKQNAQMRGNFNLELYNKISKIQLPQEEKKKLADFQINTDINIETQINEIIKKL